MTWQNIGSEFRINGESTVYYRDNTGRFTIESRKRRVPDAPGRSRLQRTYMLIDGDTGKVTEYKRLQAAKQRAVQILEGLT